MSKPPKPPSLTSTASPASRTNSKKRKVERPFHYIETNLLNGREFRSLDHLHEVARWWLAEVADTRVHGTTKKTPLELHAEELPHLLPLPALRFDSQFLEGLLAKQRYGKHDAQRVLSLLHAYSLKDILAAMSRAIQYHAYGYQSLERILAHFGTPKPSWEVLSDKEQDALKRLTQADPLGRESSST